MLRSRSSRSFSLPLLIVAALAAAPRGASADGQPATPAAPATPVSPATPATSATSASIPANLTIHAELRHRWEIDARAKFNPKLSTTEESFLRSRLAVSAALPKKVTLFLEGQDARVWGQEPSTTSSSSPGGDLHQGFVVAEDFMSPGVWLKLGRFEMSYDNERLIGAFDWSNGGRAFDGVVVGYKRASFDVQAFETKIAEGVGNVTRGRDHDFFGAHATTTALARHTVSAFAYYDRDADTLATGEEMLKRLTAGGRVVGSQGSIGYSAEAAAQTGDAGRTSVSASMLGVRVSYELASNAYHPKVEVGLDRLSGDGDTSDKKTKAFDTLFGTNHAFYGAMDLFTNIPRDTDSLGLVDVMVNLSVRPSQRFSARLGIHSFKSAEDFVKVATNGTKETISSFGTELDLVADFGCTDNVSVQGGAAAFLPGDIFDATRGSDKAYWSYLQTRISY